MDPKTSESTETFTSTAQPQVVPTEEPTEPTDRAEALPPVEMSASPPPPVTPPEPPSPAPAEEDPPQEAEAKTLTIPTSAMKALKASERERGRTEAASAYDEKLAAVARMFGFEGFDEMAKADPELFWKAKQGQSRSEVPREQPPGETPPKDDEHVTTPDDTTPDRPRLYSKLQKENQHLLEEKKRLNRARAHSERRTKAIEAKLAAQEAENELRVAAARAGVQDIDYALHMTRKTLKGKTAEELQSFEASKFFGEELREQHPHLYQVQVEPAHTGHSTAQAQDGGAPLPKAPSAAAKGEANGVPSTDARSLSKEDFSKLLAKHNLMDPSIGMPT